MRRPKVTIVILNYNGKKYLGELLDKALKSALNQTYVNVDILFVDNGSDDDSVNHIMSIYGNKVKVVKLGRNYGFCLGNNLALKYISSDAKYILFMNPDAILTEDYVKKLVHFMEEHEWIGMAQGLQRAIESSFCSIGGYVDSYGKAVEISINGLENKLMALSKLFIMAWVSGSAMIVRRELFERLKGFSPELFMYHDEIDLCARALFLGFKSVCYPQVAYYHKRGMVAKSKEISWLPWYFSNRNKWLTTLRYFPLKHVVMSFLLAFPIEGLINVLKSFRKGGRIRLRLMIRTTKYIISNLRRELAIRRTWASKHSLLTDFIINLRSPLARKGLKEQAIKKTLLLRRLVQA